MNNPCFACIAQFLKTSNAIYQLEWYRYPIRKQKYIHLMLQRMQSPICLKGCGLIPCHLGTFTEVLRTVGSVLTLLQSMNQ